MRINRAEMLETLNIPIITKPEILILSYLEELIPNVIDIKTLHNDFVKQEFGFKSHEKTRQMCLKLSIGGYVQLKKYGKHIMLLPIKRYIESKQTEE